MRLFIIPKQRRTFGFRFKQIVKSEFETEYGKTVGFGYKKYPSEQFPKGIKYLVLNYQTTP